MRETQTSALDDASNIKRFLTAIENGPVIDANKYSSKVKDTKAAFPIVESEGRESPPEANDIPEVKELTIHPGSVQEPVLMVPSISEDTSEGISNKARGPQKPRDDESPSAFAIDVKIGREDPKPVESSGSAVQDYPQWYKELQALVKMYNTVDSSKKVPQDPPSWYKTFVEQIGGSKLIGTPKAIAKDHPQWYTDLENRMKIYRSTSGVDILNPRDTQNYSPIPPDYAQACTLARDSIKEVLQNYTSKARPFSSHSTSPPHKTSIQSLFVQQPILSKGPLGQKTPVLDDVTATQVSPAADIGSTVAAHGEAWIDPHLSMSKPPKYNLGPFADIPPSGMPSRTDLPFLKKSTDSVSEAQKRKFLSGPNIGHTSTDEGQSSLKSSLYMTEQSNVETKPSPITPCQPIQPALIVPIAVKQSKTVNVVQKEMAETPKASESNPVMANSKELGHMHHKGMPHIPTLSLNSTPVAANFQSHEVLESDHISQHEVVQVLPYQAMDHHDPGTSKKDSAITAKPPHIDASIRGSTAQTIEPKSLPAHSPVTAKRIPASEQIETTTLPTVPVNEVTSEHVPYFSSWGTPQQRVRAAARIRKVILTATPPFDSPSPQLIASLVFGGPLEQIVTFPTHASVTFLDADDCEKYYAATGNGIKFDKDRIADVRLSTEVDVIGGRIQALIDREATRCVRAVGNLSNDIPSTLTYLETMAKGRMTRERKIERILKGKTARNVDCTTWRFCGVRDAEAFITELTRNEDWEHCNIGYAPDPCALATGLHVD